MDHTRLFAISAAGMAVERARVEVATANIANANTVQVNGVGYQPLRIEARAVVPSLPSFADQVEEGLGESGPLAISLPQASVEPTGAAPKVVHDPENPFADSKGDVTYPGVDTATEMVSLMRALRAYEANVAALNLSRTLVLKSLEIGGGT